MKTTLGLMLWCVIGAVVFGLLAYAFGVPSWLQLPMMFWLGVLIAYTRHVRDRERRR